jgi:hypothetical protein
MDDDGIDEASFENMEVGRSPYTPAGAQDL